MKLKKSQKLRKSKIEDFDYCPGRYKAIWIDGITTESEVAGIGQVFHDWTGDFFDVLDRGEVAGLLREEDIQAYFMQHVDESWPERLILGCTNFCKFETEHLLMLRQTFASEENVWYYFVPAHVEFEWETPTSTGTVDRISNLTDGTYMATDYKPKVRTTKHRREVTWYAENLNRYEILDAPVTLGSVYGYLTNQHWIFQLHKRTLQAINNRIKAINECHRTGVFPLKVGNHCMFCPIFGECIAIKEGVDWEK